jgi:hypothetical protein
VLKEDEARLRQCPPQVWSTPSLCPRRPMRSHGTTMTTTITMTVAASNDDTRTRRWTPRARRVCGVIPRVRVSARVVRSFAISGRRGITWAGESSSAGTGSCIPVRAVLVLFYNFQPVHSFAHICVVRTPGDPLRYHSHFVATVQASPSTPLRPMEVVAHGRLGTATKKAHLLCGWDPESREVTYISIEWAGFG